MILKLVVNAEGGKVGTMQPWMALGASLVAKVVDYTVAPLGHQLRYLYQYKKNADNLRKQAEWLQCTTDDVQQLVNKAKRNTREIKSTVESWLPEVDTITAEIKSWDDEPNLSKMRLPRLVSRYKQSKMAAKKIVTIQELLGRTPKEDVSILQAPPLNIPFISDLQKPKEYHIIEMGASSSSAVDQNVSTNGALLTMDPIISNQLRKNVANIIHQQREAVHQIIEELHDDRYEAIGIYGMGGIGKTTLAKEVGKVARDCGVVKEVIMVVVSQEPNTREIQGQIADRFGLRLKE
ncbi:disease resistance protein SUMM2-like [Lycium ferocissimum]|uniref:disease resistance protein SUMM2-like n=1 Tax=Lycium ferocissimum TaxID=112874 RepID=UPI0028160A7C|nr:disease resistance protein SUMM2-like [Lycium ferocissimum]